MAKDRMHLPPSLPHMPSERDPLLQQELELVDLYGGTKSKHDEGTLCSSSSRSNPKQGCGGARS